MIKNFTETGKSTGEISLEIGVAQNSAMKCMCLRNLVVEITVAWGVGIYREYMEKLKKMKLLMVVEWFRYLLKENEVRDALELAEPKAKTASTIFALSSIFRVGMKTCIPILWLIPSVAGLAITPYHPDRRRHNEKAEGYYGLKTTAWGLAA